MKEGLAGLVHKEVHKNNYLTLPEKLQRQQSISHKAVYMLVKKHGHNEIDLANVLGCGVSTLRHWCNRGELLMKLDGFEKQGE